MELAQPNQLGLNCIRCGFVWVVQHPKAITVVDVSDYLRGLRLGVTQRYFLGKFDISEDVFLIYFKIYLSIGQFEK